MNVIKQIKGHPFRFGGQRHSGWLPQNAAEPLPTPTNHALVDFEIRGDGNGFYLYWTAQDLSRSGDTWHQTLDDALNQAEIDFGIQSSQWQDAVD